MFYETLLMLCEEMGISLTTLLTKHLKMSSGNITKWKENKIPRSDTLQKIAEFFDVSTDYLLGKTDIKKEPSIEEDAELMELLKKPALKAAWDLLKQMDERQIDVAYSQLEALMRLQDK